MLHITTVTSLDELLQVHRLNQSNLKTNLSQIEQEEQGFVTWLYSIELLHKMHELAPSIIIKDNDKVVAYALTTLKESLSFHPDLKEMFSNLQQVTYQNKNLSEYSFYCMGQICVAKAFRGMNLVHLLYQKHKEVYSKDFDFILTEISSSNKRSLKAHFKTGFQTINTYRDSADEWEVVIWDWK